MRGRHCQSIAGKIDSVTEHEAILGWIDAQRDALRQRLIDWCNINSYTYNLSGGVDAWAREGRMSIVAARIPEADAARRAPL